MSTPTGAEAMETAAAEAQATLVTALGDAPTPEIAAAFDAVVGPLYSSAASVEQARNAEPDEWRPAGDRRRELSGRVRESLTAAEQAIQAAEEAAPKLEAALEAAMRPQRPHGDAAEQEAALRNVRDDLRMRLDATPSDQLAATLGSLVDRYRSAGDELTVWLLTGTPWPDDYLESRRAPIELDRWRGQVRPEAISQISNPIIEGASRLAAKLRGPNGLSAAVVARRQATRFALDDFARIR